MNTNKDDLLTRISKWLMPSMWRENVCESTIRKKPIREGYWGPTTQKRPDPPPAPPRPGRVSRPRKKDSCDLGSGTVDFRLSKREKSFQYDDHRQSVTDCSGSSGGGDW